MTAACAAGYTMVAGVCRLAGQVDPAASSGHLRDWAGYIIGGACATAVGVFVLFVLAGARRGSED